MMTKRDRTSIPVPGQDGKSLHHRHIGAFPFSPDVAFPDQRALRQAFDQIIQIAERRHAEFAKRSGEKAAQEDPRPWRERIARPEARLVADQRRASADLKALADARGIAAKEFVGVLDQRERLFPYQIDPKDYAAALRRESIRRAFQGMDTSARTAFLSRMAGDADVAAAILELPPEVNGLPQASWERFSQEALRARHGEELDRLAQLEAACAVIERAANATRSAVEAAAVAELGMRAHEFREFAADAEAKAA